VQDQAVDDNRPVAQEKQHVDSPCDGLTRQVAVSEAASSQSVQSCISYICVPLSSIMTYNDAGVAFVSLDGFDISQLISVQQTLGSTPRVTGSLDLLFTVILK